MPVKIRSFAPMRSVEVKTSATVAVAAPPPPAMALPSTFGRIEAVLHVLRATNARRYLEIGCRDDECFAHAREAVPEAVGIDPTMGGTLRLYSDEFFLGEPDPFDVVFIDGSHHHDQVLRDIENSITFLNPGGVILMHDVWPFALHMESLDYSGTVWRAFVKGARTRRDVEAFASTVPQDPVGVGIMRVRPNTAVVTDPRVQDMDALVLGDLFAHEHDWMRRISFEEACRRLELPAP